MSRERQKVGRPKVDVPARRVLEMRAAGESWRSIGRTLRMAVTTIRRAWRRATNAPTACQNSRWAVE